MNNRNEEILLVEDDPADAELTLMAIGNEKLTAKVHVARDGAEALDFVFCRGSYAERKFEQPPKLILLDLKLPKISGHQVLRAIKSDPRTCSIPVVVLTSSDQDRDLVKCLPIRNQQLHPEAGRPPEVSRKQSTTSARTGLRVNQPPPLAAFVVPDSGAKP